MRGCDGAKRRRPLGGQGGERGGGVSTAGGSLWSLDSFPRREGAAIDFRSGCCRWLVGIDMKAERLLRHLGITSLNVRTYID